MTVSYSDAISCILCRWRGSVWKTIWKQLLVWLGLWYMIHFMVKFALSEEQQETAAQVIESFASFCRALPVVFLLGFYVVQILSRWWRQLQAIPWPDDFMGNVTIILKGVQDEQPKREATARWLILSEALAFRQISRRVYKRFPELENLIDAGLLTDEELGIIKRNKCEYVHWEMPLQWINSKVLLPTHYNSNRMLNYFRDGLRQLFMYDWVAIPLVYTQTVSVVIYGYFAMALIGHQYEIKVYDLYFPWLSVLKFIFFVGWYKVACDMLYPFGEYNEDCELNYFLDRHASVAISMAREVKFSEPDILVDEKQQDEMGRKMMTNLTYSLEMAKISDRPPKIKSVSSVKREQREQVEKKDFEEVKRFCGAKICRKPRSHF